MCVCVCVCVYIYIYIHIYHSIFIYIETYRYIHIQIKVCINTHTRTHIYICRYILMYIDIYMNTNLFQYSSFRGQRNVWVFFFADHHCCRLLVYLWRRLWSESRSFFCMGDLLKWINLGTGSWKIFPSVSFLSDLQFVLNGMAKRKWERRKAPLVLNARQETLNRLHESAKPL